MIIDRNWNKKEQKLIISYVDKQGNRQFFQRYLHHIKTYEYDPDGEYETWDGKKCRAVFKDTSNYVPNEFDILEFMYELPKETLDILHAQYFPKLYTFDIETEVSNDFPDPEVAAQKITAISIVGPDLSCIVYGLHQMDESSVELFRQRYLDWIKENEFASMLCKTRKYTPKVLYQWFPSEQEMLKRFLTVIVPKISCLAGWNSYNFDWRYIVNRCARIFDKGEYWAILRKSSPTGELTQVSWEEQNGLHYRVTAPMHSQILDYMQLVKDYDYSLRPYESYSLDWVGSHAVNAHKIKYEGTLQQLYEKYHEWYYFYNAVDSLIVMLIHYKLKCLESVCAVDAVTLVPMFKSMGQVALTTANVFNEFYMDNKHVVWDYDAIERYKIQYEGAFCGCVPGRYEWNVCDDFASLYPSQVQTCNFSFENFMEPPLIGPDDLGRYTPGSWTEEELDNFRKDPNYFVSINGNVYKNDKDYAFKKMQRRVKKLRDKYKYTGQDVDAILIPEIERLIKEKEQAA